MQMCSFLKEAFKQWDRVSVENISCLILRFDEAEFAHVDVSFCSHVKNCGLKNIRGTITSHKEQSQRAASLGNKEETDAVCSHVSVVAPFAGVASQPGPRV